MPRRRQHQATDAAQAASEAARVLQQRAQEVKKEEPPERVPEPKDEVPDDWVPPKRDDTHQRMLEEVISNRNKEAPKEEPKAEEPQKEEPKAEAPVEPEAPAAPEAPVVEMVKVKVDGEEFEVPKEEVEEYGGVRAYQIHKASENRLKKSNEVLAEGRKFQAAMLEVLQNMQQVQRPKEPEVTEDQFIASKLDTIRFGTPEEASKAWLEIQQRHNKPVDTNAIIEQATNRFRHDQAVQDFDKEFQDISANPMLLKLVVSLRNERIPQMRGPVDWHKFYRDIGNEVRSAFGKPTSAPTAQAATQGNPSQQSEREARKAATVVNLPAAAARAASPKEEQEETPEQTRRNTLIEMKKKRGLPVD